MRIFAALCLLKWVVKFGGLVKRQRAIMLSALLPASWGFCETTWKSIQKGKGVPRPLLFAKRHFGLCQRADFVSLESLDRIAFQGKPRCLAAVENFSFRHHNTLTHVSFILAPRLGVIGVTTAAHWVTDEIKLLAEEICLLCLWCVALSCNLWRSGYSTLHYCRIN